MIEETQNELFHLLDYVFLQKGRVFSKEERGYFENMCKRTVFVKNAVLST